MVTFASKITLSRLLLVPVYAGLAIAYGRGVAAGSPHEALRWWALAVFVIAAGTDGIDGWIARRFNQRSDFGAFIDPIADKALVLTAIVVLSLVPWGENGWSIPVWFLALVILRDGVILGGIIVLWSARRKVRIAPHWSGKVCTVTQMFLIGWVMLKVVPFSPLYPCLLAAIFTTWSMVAYIGQGWRILRTSSGETAQG